MLFPGLAAARYVPANVGPRLVIESPDPAACLDVRLDPGFGRVKLGVAGVVILGKIGDYGLLSISVGIRDL
jgi:hypothetical protein